MAKSMNRIRTGLSIGAMLLPFALALLAVWWNIGAVKEALVQANVAADTVEAVRGEFGQLLWISAALFVCAALIAAGFAVFFGRANVRPMQAMALALRQGDISEDLATKDNEVCREYNGFIKKLRDILGHTRRIGLEVAVSSTEVARAVKDLRAKAKKHGDLLGAIFHASADMNHKIVDVSRNHHSLHQSAATNLVTAKSSLEELRKVSISIDETKDSAAQFARTAERLTTTSQHIKGMADLVYDISSQLHSLALKAATEAGRAGDQGGGLAAVADEMKKMAERTSAVGGGEILVNMMAMVRDVQDMGGGIHANMGGMSKAVNSTIGHFEKLVRTFEDNQGKLSKIEVAVEELSTKNRVIHAQVTDARELSKQVETVLGDAALAATSMNRKTETLLEAVSQFKIGNDALEQTIAAVTAHRDLIQSKIAAISGRGIDVFDRQYQPVPKTEPQKFRTAYDSHFDQELQVVFDSALQDLDAVYCVAVDVNGYVATHHSWFSKPMTGNYETDLLYSRDKRMYNSNDTEIRRSKNTNPFLLQTYLRDTGEILNDLSLPLYINGKHWGALVTGLQPQKLQQRGASGTQP